jgi:PAS domain-containing protein
MRELDHVRDGVAVAASGTRPLEWPGLSPETEAVFHALHRFADLVAREREGSEKARVLARTVFEEVPVGLVVVDRTLAVLDVNPSARLLFGVPPQAACPALHDIVRDPEVLALFRSLIGKGGPRTRRRPRWSSGGKGWRGESGSWRWRPAPFPAGPPTGSPRRSASRAT